MLSVKSTLIYKYGTRAQNANFCCFSYVRYLKARMVPSGMCFAQVQSSALLLLLRFGIFPDFLAEVGKNEHRSRLF